VFLNATPALQKKKLFFLKVALRWIVENGASFTTCSSKKEHFEEDLAIFDFKLEPQEMLTLNTLMGRVAVQ
jgi:diketogulonate reductase-like aldo/keto reductase